MTAFDRPKHFQDVMISGAFRSMVHDHEFAEVATGTVMRDRFEFESPLGILGRMANWLFLTFLHAAVPCPPESGAETVGGIHGRQPLPERIYQESSPLERKLNHGPNPRRHERRAWSSRLGLPSRSEARSHGGRCYRWRLTHETLSPS